MQFLKEENTALNAISHQHVREKRQGWKDAFKEMTKNGDDQLLIPAAFEDEDLEDWTWQKSN